MNAQRTDPVALARALETGQPPVSVPSLSTGPSSPANSFSTIDPEPFPIEALHASIREFVAVGASARGVPPEFVAVPLMAFTGAVIGAGITLQIKRGWVEYPVLWVGVVGKPGTGKSPAQDYAAKPIRAVQHKLTAEWQKEKEAFEEIPLAERKVKPPPKLKSVFTTDATIEAVSDMLGRRNGIVIERDEIAGFTASFDAYKKGGDRQLYLSSWAVAPWKVDRKTSGSVCIDRPIVCIAGGIQPERLQDLRGGTVDDGFPDRFLLSFPLCEPTGYNDTEDDPELIMMLTNVFHGLYQLSGSTTVVTMTPQAHALFVTYCNENAATLRTATGLSAGWIAKAPSHLARIALVMHALSERDPRETLTVSTLDSAIQVTEYFRSHFIRCLPLMGATGTGEPAGDIPRIRRYLLESGGSWVPRSELMQKTRLSASRMTDSLTELERRGEAVRNRVKTGAHEREDWRLVTLN